MLQTHGQFNSFEFEPKSQPDSKMCSDRVRSTTTTALQSECITQTQSRKRKEKNISFDTIDPIEMHFALIKISLCSNSKLRHFPKRRD